MVPVVSTAKELRLIVPRVEAAVADELKKAGVEVRSKPKWGGGGGSVHCLGYRV